MRSAIFLVSAAGLLAGCSPLPKETARAVGLGPSGYDVIRNERQFVDRVVGETLLGSGLKVDVQPGGTLSGVYLSERFNGTWIFVDGRLCVSLRGDVEMSIDRTCYWVAAEDGAIRLFPAPYPAP
ncbi:MAG: hypothetical protein OIF40_06560 [Mangrovicoccus sp.]|nr:hypothetical protein [Mangrovicoccus sp.]